jgi:uncharacterized membrane protein YcjF (UPF0283 family)
MLLETNVSKSNTYSRIQGAPTFWPYLAYARSVLMHIAVDGILDVVLGLFG